MSIKILLNVKFQDDMILVKFDEGNVTVTRGYQGINSLEMREISDGNYSIYETRVQVYFTNV